MKNLSEELMLAVLNDDKKEAARIKSLVEARHASEIKKKPVVISNPFPTEVMPARLVIGVMENLFGEDWFDLDQDTIWELFARRGITPPTSNVKDCILAAKACHHSISPWQDWFDFSNVCLAFCGAMAELEILRTPTIAMIISGINTMLLIRPDELISKDVENFIEAKLLEEGIYTPPPSLLGVVDLDTVVRHNWMDIYKAYNKIAAGALLHNDDVVSIQANRLYRIEHAAKEFYGMEGY